MPERLPVCPECGTALTGVSQTQLQQHIDEKRDIICGTCGASSRAKEWRDGLSPAKLREKQEEDVPAAPEESSAFQPSPFTVICEVPDMAPNANPGLVSNPANPNVPGPVIKTRPESGSKE